MQIDEDMDMARMVQEAFQIYDNLREGELGAAENADIEMETDNI